MKHPTLVWLAVTCLLVCAAEAQGNNTCEGLADNASYQEMAAKGIAAVKAGSYTEAMEQFVAAQKICPYDPAVTYYMARTKHLSGDCVTAVMLYEQALAQLGAGLVITELTVEGVTKRRDEAQVCANTPSVGSVTIQCVDAGVSLVFEDGREEPCPFAGELAPGSWTLTAKLAKHEPQSVSLNVVAGESTQANVGALAAQALVEEPKRVEDNRSNTDTVVAAEVTPVADGSGSAVLGWVSVGVGVALVGTGVALHFVAEGTRAEVEDASLEYFGDYPVVTSLSRAEAQEKMSSANTLDLVGWTAVGVGGAAVVTGALLLLLDGDGPASEVSGAWWGAGGAVVWTRRF